MNNYTTPELVPLGSIESLTAALGSSSAADQSDFPEEFPPDTGSFDICDNENPNSEC